MKFGVCLLSIIPLRKEPSEPSEMVSQIIFGELVIIEDDKNGWLHIRIVYDNYEGWVDKKQITELEESEFNRLNKAPCQYSKDLIEIIQEINGNIIPIIYGSTIRLFEDGNFTLSGRKFKYEGQLSHIKPEFKVESLIEDAMLFRNAPYLWGGKSPFGLDCSGFIQSVFKANGIKLLRDSGQQSTQGETISLLDEAMPGDLVFFDNDEGEINHVGLIVGTQKIIHASAHVRVDTIDYHGIYNAELKKYTHNLRLIKRII
jgi:hypothetical protein